MRQTPAIAIALTLTLAGGALAQDGAVRGAWTLSPDGSWRENATITIRSGRIASVGAGPADAHQYDNAYVTPGLIELASQVGLAGDASEQTRPNQMDLRAAAAFDPHDPDADAALRAGITAAMIIPTPRAPLAGRVAVVRTAPTATGTADILRNDSAALFAVTPGVTNTLFGPTSRAGAMTMIREAVASARRRGGFVATSMQRDGGIVVAGSTADDIYTIMQPFEIAGVTPTIVTKDDALDIAFDMASDLEDGGYRFVVGPLTRNDQPEVLAGAGALTRSGATVGLAASTTADDPDALRRSAALATRYGLSPADARLAMTRRAAEIAGVADRLGTIERGRDADLVVWTHDPLRPEARVIAVYVNGRRVHHDPAVAGTPGKIDGWDDRPGRPR